MNLHFCHVCNEIRDTAEGFCVMCHTFLGPTHPTLKFHPDAFSMVWPMPEPKTEDPDA